MHQYLMQHGLAALSLGYDATIVVYIINFLSAMMLLLWSISCVCDVVLLRVMGC